jgi:PAS domain S-box-containing protein
MKAVKPKTARSRTSSVENRWRQREEYFRSLIEYSSDLITVVDAGGVIRFQSPSVQRVLHWKPEQMTSRSLAEFVHPEDLPRLRAMIDRALARPDAPVSIEYRLRHRDGNWHLFAAIGRSLPPAREGPRVVFNARDITVSRNLEEQLLQAQKMEAIGTLAGGIAHDFNNALAGILGSAELVRGDLPPDHPSQPFVQAILTAGQRARELVQQILTFSRRQESEKRILSLQSIVAECVKLLRSTIPVMVKITHHVEADCPPVLANPTQMHQVIMNLCTNAWHALPESGGHIDISLRAVEVTVERAMRHGTLRPGTYVRLAVADNGRGMDAATQARIFEPFFTTKSPSQGSGLGLSVVHGIVKAHRGAILVESQPGQGATFEVYLPARSSDQPSVAQPVTVIPRGRGERILFVEDEPIVARSTEEILKRLGYAVTRCEQSEEALARFRQAPGDFDLILTDWEMPGMSGAELAAAVHAVRPDMPLLLISGFVGYSVEKTAQTIGRGKVLVKPVSPDVLAQTIAHMLSPVAPASATPPAVRA